MDLPRHHVLLIAMPVFFLSTGPRTNWSVGGEVVFKVSDVRCVGREGARTDGPK